MVPIESEEEWDDEMPQWAQSAQSVDGVEFVDYVEPTPRPKRPAVIGFMKPVDLIVPFQMEFIPYCL